MLIEAALSINNNNAKLDVTYYRSSSTRLYFFTTSLNTVPPVYGFVFQVVPTKLLTFLILSFQPYLNSITPKKLLAEE